MIASFFATAFFGIVDADHRSMSYVSAGHEASYLVNGCGHRFLDATGPILGLCDDDRALRVETVLLDPATSSPR
jgi:serine phosphatase RsbU (regulator of sigma subunit)